MGNYLQSNFEDEDENLSIEISLPKSCYYPGEKLSGFIILQAKTNKVPLVFNFPNSILTLNQHQKSQFYHENILINKEENKSIFFRRFNFKKYKNRDILSPLKIYFSIRIPVKTLPTLLHKESNFIRHYLTIKFPKIQKKKSVGIFIQNKQVFNLENKLFKSPSEKFKDCIQSPIFSKSSKLAFLLKTDKNSYAYNELIPYEIVINYTESDINIKNLRVSLTRNVFIHSDEFIEVKFLIYKDYNMPTKSTDGNNVFQISGYFSLPPISEYFSVNPMNVYNFYSNKVINDIDKTFNSTYLYPTCVSNYLCCNYCLNLEVNFNSTLVKNECLYIPLELYTPLKIVDDIEEEEEKEEEIEEEEINIDNEDINGNKSIINNTPNLDENDNNIDFEIINKLDFYKALSEEKY